MFAAVMVILGVVFLALAAFNLGLPRVRLEWLGLACLAMAFFAHSLPGLN